MDKRKIVKILSEALKHDLSILDLTGKGIQELPSEIGQLPNLTTLKIGYNPNIKIPSEIRELKNLKRIELNDNSLKYFPRELFDLINLQELFIRNNEIVEISPEIQKLENLRIIDLDNNLLSALPEEFWNLTKLEDIFLRNNRLSELSDAIGNLTELIGLYLGGNEISQLPYSISKLTNLFEIDLSGNPIQNILPETITKGLDAILRHIKLIEKEGYKGENLYESKLLLVGQGYVGKTNLLRRLSGQDFAENLPSTRGIEIHKYQIVSPDDKNITMILNIWDFGGQDIYHGIHQFFLTKRSLYILVLDAIQGEENCRIDHWLTILDIYADNSPIMIAKNKTEERNLNINETLLKKHFSQIDDFYNISCKTFDGIDRFKYAIQKNAWKLPLMGKFWSNMRLQIRQILEKEGKRRNLMPVTEYVDICKKHGFNRNEAEDLCQWLNDLGIILHYPDEYLNETIFLNPEWLIKAFYLILDSKIAHAKQGFIEFSQLSKIWIDTTLFPPETYMLLIQLMAKFRLLFLSNNGNLIIIPALLSFEAQKDNWDYKNNLVFEYHYDFFLPGIIHNFIVDTNKIIMREGDNFRCWQEGLILEFEMTFALIQLFTLEKVVEIRIRGQDKQRLRDIISYFFTDIHKNFKSKVSEKIPCNCQANCEFRFDFEFINSLDKNEVELTHCHKSKKEVKIKPLLIGFEEDKKKETDIAAFLKIIEELKKFMGDTINIHDSSDFTFIKDSRFKDVQNIKLIESNIDFSRLVIELQQLRAELKKQSGEIDDKTLDKAIFLVGEAEEAAKEHDTNTILQKLQKAGKWALNVSQEIGIQLTAELLKKGLIP